MARTKEKWSGEFTGPPELVARHVEFPAELYDDPGRPIVITMPLSSVRRLIKSLAKLEARATGTRALFESPEFLETGDGAERPDE